MKNKLIFIELNEINFDLIKKYSENYNFKVFNKFFFQNLKRTTSENKYHLLEPWIQWASVHTGLSAEEHGIFRLGDFDGKNLKHIFKEIENKGYEVGAICPMNITNDLIRSKYFIPDPWIKNQEPKSYFQNIIYKSLSEAVNNNSGSKISFKSKLIIFLTILLFVRKKNIFKLISLFFKSFVNKWNKALIFDYLINEIHIKYLKRYKTDFSTIFFNAGAHIQHHYLNNSKILKNKKNPEWYIKSGIDPIFETYIFYDEIIYEYFKMKNTSLLIATGLTQQPYEQNTFYYRLSDHEKFMKILDVKFESIHPRMSRDFLVTFREYDECDEFEKKLFQINKINKIKLFEIENRGKDAFVTLVYSQEIKKNFKININENLIIDLYKHVNFVAIKNGEHAPNGFLFAKGSINEFINSQNFHVKNIYNVIDQYFEND